MPKQTRYIRTILLRHIQVQKPLTYWMVAVAFILRLYNIIEYTVSENEYHTPLINISTRDFITTNKTFQMRYCLSYTLRDIKNY